MLTPEPKHTNARQMAKVRTLVEELLVTISRPGFHGEGGIQVSIHDGVIQHIRCKIDQLAK